MKLADHLSDKQMNQLSKMHRKKKQPKKNAEKFSRKDIEELMGIHMDTYARHKGAIRRK